MHRCDECHYMKAENENRTCNECFINLIRIEGIYNENIKKY